MLVNRWLIRRIAEATGEVHAGHGILLEVTGGYNYSAYIKFFQEYGLNLDLSLLLTSGDLQVSQPDDENVVEDIIALFFQPGYYFHNGRPVVFLTGNDPPISVFADLLTTMAMAQGFTGVNFIVGRGSPGDQIHPVGGYSHQGDFDISDFWSTWVDAYLEHGYAGEIHLLTDDRFILDSFGKLSEEMMDRNFSIAAALYENEKMLWSLKAQLQRAHEAEKGLGIYLGTQKAEMSNIFKWYHNEYEILPRWYKRFGQILKVLMGKRSLKSLFRNNVKKYRD